MSALPLNITIDAEREAWEERGAAVTLQLRLLPQTSEQTGEEVVKSSIYFFMEKSMCVKPTDLSCSSKYTRSRALKNKQTTTKNTLGQIWQMPHSYIIITTLIAASTNRGIQQVSFCLFFFQSL